MPYFLPNAGPSPATNACHPACSTRRSIRPGDYASRPTQAPAIGANPGKNRVVVGDIKPTLFRRHVTCDQRHRNLNIQQSAAPEAMHVIVPFDATVVAARLVGEGELLDQAMFRQQMQRAVHGPVGYARIATSYAFEDLSGGQMLLRESHFLQHQRPLGRILELPSGRHSDASQMRISLTNTLAMLPRDTH